MTTEKSTLQRIWSTLHPTNSNQQGWQLCPVSSPSSGMVYAGRYYPENREALVVLFHDFVPDTQWRLPDSRGFQVQIMPPQNNLAGYGIALCRKPDGALDLFTLMSEDLLAMVKQQQDVQPEMVLQRVQAWQKFMQSDDRRKLTLEQARGLWGELELIQQLADAGIPITQIITAWKGPLSSLHDFQFRRAHIEVKTASANTGFTLFIENLAQLEHASELPLYLAAFMLQSDDTGRDLPQQVENVQRLIGEDLNTVSLFQSLLLNIGYLSADASLYKQKYRVLRKRYCWVNEHFPTLTSQNTPPEISTASYTIQLDRVSEDTTIPFPLFCEGLKNE